MNSISKRLLMLLMLAPLAVSCQTRGIATTDKAVCALWSGVTFSAAQDSGQTVDEIRALNAKRDAYCGGRK